MSNNKEKLNDKHLIYLDDDGDKIMLDKRRQRTYYKLINIITWNKKTAFIRGSKPILLRIEQRRVLPPEGSKIDDKKRAKHLSPIPHCLECYADIDGNLFQCFQCEGDYIMCGSCLISGKHPEHHIIIRATDSKV